MKITLSKRAFVNATLCAISLWFLPSRDVSAQGRRGRNAGPPTLGLEQGFIELETPDFNIKLVRASQTLAALQPKGADGFDFTPADQLTNRVANRFYHLGDLTFRLRTNGADGWENYSTADARHPVTALPAAAPALASADLSPTLPDGCPLQITRTWTLDNGRLALEFDVKNKSSAPVEIGALGIPLIFNNYITGHQLAEAQAMCAFSDPAICMDGGYVQVTRLSGHGPALVVVEEGRTPLEAYNPLQRDVIGDRTPISQTFEAFYEWMPLTLAYASNEWKNAEPWNRPTSETLAPGAAKTFGIKFLRAPEIRDIDKTLEANDRPVAIGIPGYILPMGMDGRLFLKYSEPVKSIESDPKSAITVKDNPPAKNGWAAFTLHGEQWGRTRLRIEYADGLVQTISYDVIKPEAKVVADLGHFLFTKQWYTDTNDPFHRAPSVMTYDRANNRIVLQDSRAWIAGLEDEGGSGSWVAATMKEFGEPDKSEVEKLEQFVDGVLWGGIQYSDGPQKYGVRKSLFYWDPQAITNYYSSDVRYGGWTSWNKRDSERIDRAYNYPHVVAAYYTMYRLARDHTGLVTNHPWQWYLDHAYQTVKFLTGRDVGYIDTGLMEGDVFVMLLKDLKREGWNDQAADMEQGMKRRAEGWNRERFPFGSEQAWDSTGQEEVFAWTQYFGYQEKAQVALDSILGYMPTVPSWAYNGNARRYWDFIYGAAPGGTYERQIHHYGSGINAIPVLASYREHPDDFYLLQVGYGGEMGALSSIDAEGFASAAFHSWPNKLKWDAYSGDYGPNFFGHAICTGTYIIDHPDFGWQAYGGDVKTSGDWVTVRPLDDFRMRVFVAPLGLWLTLEAGQFDSVAVNSKTHAVRVELSPADQYTPQARLRIEQPAKIEGVGAFHPDQKLTEEREAFNVPLSSRTTQIDLSAGN